MKSCVTYTFRIQYKPLSTKTVVTKLEQQEYSREPIRSSDTHDAVIERRAALVKDYNPM